MISFSTEPGRDDCDCDSRVHGETAIREPRAVGQLMAAVLARYGIAANVSPRLPNMDHQPAQLDGLMSVG